MRRHLLMVLAGVVVASLVGIAQSGAISSEADYDAAMKEVGATFGALQSDMEARDGEAVLAGTAKLADLFEQVQGFWASHDVPAAAAIATAAAIAATETATAIPAAKAAAITAAEPIALKRLVRSEIARGATETIEIVFPETVAFVLSAAASSVVTHNSNNTLSCSRKSEATDTRTACRIDAGGHVTLPLWSHHSAKDRQVRMIYVQQ